MANPLPSGRAVLRSGTSDWQGDVCMSRGGATAPPATPVPAPPVEGGVIRTNSAAGSQEFGASALAATSE